MRIGHLLVRADLVTETQLSRALEVQNFAGGRIGTLLLERTSLGDDDLGKTLALQHGCGYVSWNTLSALAPEMLAVLPPRFALKHSAIPYECGESYVKMALCDPNDLRTLDELVFVTGRKVFAAVAPEARIYQALEKYYGKLRAPRYALLAERLSRSQKTATMGSAASAPAPTMTPAASSASARSQARQVETGRSLAPPATWSSYLAPSSEAERSGETEGIPWDETTGGRSAKKARDPSPAPAEEPPAAEPKALQIAKEPSREASPPVFEPVLDHVLAATDTNAIAEAILLALVPRFQCAAIFSSRSDAVVGWAAAGKEAHPAALREFSVSSSEPSVFLTARLSRSFYLGPLPLLRCHEALAAALGGWPGECLVEPVLVGERTVAFLYISSPTVGSFSASDLAYVRRLCDLGAIALSKAIRLKKGKI